MDITRRDWIQGPLAWAALAAVVPARLLGQPRAQDTPSTAAFLAAVTAGELESVRTMLTADPGLLQARDGQGRSAYAVALLARQGSCAELLRERGYRPDVVEAALALDWALFETLAAETPGAVNQLHPVGGNAMVAAALGGAGSQAWQVMQFGGSSNLRAPDGFTAVRAGLEYPDLATAELTVATLLGNGGDPNAAQAGGSSPLHAAAARGSVELVEMLIRKGAIVDARDEQGRTPLALAEERGHAATAERLRRHAEIPRDHSTSRTAYDAAGQPYRAPDLSAYTLAVREQVVGVSHFQFDTLRELVEAHPALARAQATSTEITVEACAHTGQREIVAYLLERGAPYSLPTAVMRGDLARARSLLAEDPLRIHERGAHDFALLWYPVIGGGDLALAELLLERGAEVERQHHLGTTALHWAAMRGQVEMAALLIERGADVERVGRKFDAAGQTPLALALEREQPAVAALLRERGARR
jgi:ankyrin repeat protein